MLRPDTISYNPIIDEAERTVMGIGVILLLSHFTDPAVDKNELEVFVAKQKQSKAATRKRIGEISLIQETIQGELHNGNIEPEPPLESLRRAMGEVINDNNLLGKNEQYQRIIFDKPHTVPLDSLPIPGAAGRLEVVVYTGTNHADFEPDVAEEVYPAERANLTSLLYYPNLRESSRELLSYAVSYDVIPQAADLFREGKTENVFPEHFSFIESNNAWRETTEVPTLMQMKTAPNDFVKIYD